MKTFADSLLSWLRVIAEIGLTLMTVLLVVDLLFPGTTGLIDNIREIVETTGPDGETIINDRALAAVAVLLLFLLVYQRSAKPPQTD